MRTSQFLIGAASSGSGKTTFTLGLLRALKNRGLKVQPFKCGPDYLDTKHHAAAAGQTSYNLDTFMASATHVQEVYARHSRTADICITEGVMGLFDGYDNMAGSSAELAGLLHLPVILVVNARSTAYTVAAILYGFKHFRPDIQIARSCIQLRRFRIALHLPATSLPGCRRRSPGIFAQMQRHRNTLPATWA